MLNLKKDWRSLSSERGESCFVLMCVFLTRESRPKFVCCLMNIFCIFEGGGEATSTTRIGRDKNLHNNKKKK
jgi:hypothetical protein